METLNWLHLSDLHFGLKGQNVLWPNVREALYGDLETLQATTGPFSLVLFTGDLTQTGSDAEFTALQETVLEPLFEMIQRISGRCPTLLAVPGNHDLLRPEKRTAVVRQLVDDVSFSEIAEEFWNDKESEYRLAVDQCFAPYTKWWRRNPWAPANLQTGIAPGDFSTTLDTGGGGRVTVVGLNTAVRQLVAGDFEGRLVCDPRQVAAVFDGDPVNTLRRSNVTLLMTHHGPDWLSEQSRAKDYPEINPAGRFTAHLFGHMHEVVARGITLGGGPPLRLWQGPSLFSMEQIDPGHTERRHGYCVGQVAFADPAPLLRLWPRKAWRDANGWRIDRDPEAAKLRADGSTAPESLTHTLLGDSRKGEPVPNEIAQKPNRPTLPEMPALQDYFAKITSAYGAIRFVEMPHLKDTSDVKLDALYVEPMFSTHELRPDVNPRFSSERLSALEALKDDTPLVLLGDPGTGKSTLIGAIAWELSRRDSRTISTPWNKVFGGLVPLPMVLRELNLKADLSWERLIDLFLEHRLGAPLGTRDTVVALLRNGRAVVLMDGVDEIGSSAIRKKLRDAVQDGMAQYPNNRWIVTSRIVGYETAPFHTSEVTSTRKPGVVGGRTSKKVANVLFLAPFDDSQIKEFANRWYEHHEVDASAASAAANGFVAAIKGNEGTQRLARVPYLLTLMALLHHKNHRLPHGRTELYGRIAGAYLESIDVRRQLDQLPYSLAQKRKWLAAVAFQMQARRSQQPSRAPHEGNILATRQEVLRWLRKGMAESGATNSKEESEVLVDFFARRSGLLLPRGEGRFAFMHLSLQEYFAACFLEPRLTASRFVSGQKPTPTKAQIVTWAGRPTWTETFVLLFELLSDKSTQEAEGLLSHLSKASTSSMTAATIALLSEVAMNPFVQISGAARRGIREKCWQWLLRQEAGSRTGYSRDFFVHGLAGKVIRAFVAETGGDLRKAWRAGGVSDEILKSVELFVLDGCASLVDLTPLSALRSARSLSLTRCTSVTDLTPLGQLRSIRWLDLTGSATIRSLAGLEGLTSLEVLILDGCEGVVDLGPLRGLKSLKVIFLPPTPESLRPLGDLVKLSEVHLHGASRHRPVDCSALAGLPALTDLCSEDSDSLTVTGLSLSQIQSPAIRRLWRATASKGRRGKVQQPSRKRLPSPI
jgi:internalin A